MASKRAEWERIKREEPQLAELLRQLRREFGDIRVDVKWQSQNGSNRG